MIRVPREFKPLMDQLSSAPIRKLLDFGLTQAA